MYESDGMILPGWEPEPADQLTLLPVRPSRGGRAAVWAGIAALAGGVVFAVTVLTGASGGSSPEQAVERLFEAVANEDVLGVLDALPPSERDPLRGRVTELAEELKRLDILSSDLDLSKISGLDLTVDDVELTSTSLGEGVSAVAIRGGTAGYTVAPDRLPLGSVPRSLFGDRLPATTSGSDPISEGDDAQLVAIEEDGGWYVSIWYSVAEAARKDSGKPLPRYGQGLQARGEASPEAAVRAMFEAGLRLDARRVFELLAPDEARALHDYAPLFLDDIDAGAAVARSAVSVGLDDFEATVERRGSEASVGIRSLAVSGTIDGEPVGLRYDGRCMEITAEGETQPLCPQDAAMLSPIPLTPFLGGSTPSGVIVIEREGLWYVSPTRTTLDLAVNALRQVNSGDLEQLVAGFGGWFGTGLPLPARPRD